jgi:chaperone required for assembly of F1-ATPase
MRPQLRRRFYQAVDVREAAGGFAIELDGRPVRTPARGSLAAPARALADVLAAEWEAQREVINPAAMPLTRLANSIIDGVISRPGPVADEVAKYLASDMVFYRAADPGGLVARQAQHWDPVMDWARDTLGARFILGEGIAHVSQSEEALAAARRAVPQIDGDASTPWRLGALHSVTTLTGSALLALALLHGALTADAVWAAAHVDEDWNMDQWGRDDMVLRQRAFREAEMRAAATVLRLLQPAGSGDARQTG